MVTRRTMLKVLAAIGFTSATAETITASEPGFPTRTIERYEYDFQPESGKLTWNHTKAEEDFKFIVDGLVEQPVELSYAELRNLPRVEQVSDFHCVEGWTVPHVKWAGFRFKELLSRVKPQPGADYVVFHSLGETSSKPKGLDHYVESFALGALLDESQEIALVLDKDGAPLTYDRGAPVRVIAPFLQAYKSVKYVYRAEFTAEKRAGWWTAANPIYSWDAPVEPRRLTKR